MINKSSLKISTFKCIHYENMKDEFFELFNDFVIEYNDSPKYKQMINKITSEEMLLYIIFIRY